MILHVAVRNGTVGGQVFDWAVPGNAGAVSGPRSVLTSCVSGATSLTLMRYAPTNSDGERRRKLLTKGEARQAVVNSAKLPELVRPTESEPALMSAIVSRPSSVAPMSAFGTKRTSRSRPPMSAFGGKADIANSSRHVRF